MRLPQIPRAGSILSAAHRLGGVMESGKQTHTAWGPKWNKGSKSAPSWGRNLLSGSSRVAIKMVFRILSHPDEYL
jgi:hypothetical protein